MRIHTSASEMQFQQAARKAGVSFARFGRHGSRSRSHAFDVILEGSSGRRGNGGDHEAATWDEWGIFLAEVFRADPDAKCWAYDGAEHFRWVTGARFDTLTRAEQHARHKWIPQGCAATGAYAVSECRCGALQRWMLRGSFADLDMSDDVKPDDGLGAYASDGAYAARFMRGD